MSSWPPNRPAGRPTNQAAIFDSVDCDNVTQGIETKARRVGAYHRFRYDGDDDGSGNQIERRDWPKNYLKGFPHECFRLVGEGLVPFYTPSLPDVMFTLISNTFQTILWGFSSNDAIDFILCMLQCVSRPLLACACAHARVCQGRILHAYVFDAFACMLLKLFWGKYSPCKFKGWHTTAKIRACVSASNGVFCFFLFLFFLFKYWGVFVTVVYVTLEIS